jgi:hypothetical protein
VLVRSLAHGLMLRAHLLLQQQQLVLLQMLAHGRGSLAVIYGCYCSVYGTIDALKSRLAVQMRVGLYKRSGACSATFTSRTNAACSHC